MPSALQLVATEFLQPAGNKRFREIFERSNDAILVMDVQRDKILNANARACTLLDYCLDELLACPVSRIHPNEMPRLMAFVRSVTENGHGWTDELSCMTKWGRVVRSEISASYISYKEGPYLMALVRDITERKRTEADLIKARKDTELEVQIRTAELIKSNNSLRKEVDARREAESKLHQVTRDHQLILDSAGEGIIGIDRAAIINFINPDAAQLFGRQVHELVGTLLFQVLRDPRGAQLQFVASDRIQSTLSSGKKWHLEESIFCRVNSACFPVEFTCAPIFEGESIVGAVIVFRDISLRKQRAESLNLALSEIQRLKQRLDAENTYLQEELSAKGNFTGLVGISNAIQEVLRHIDQVAPTKSNVLITGESGTGKELAARAIHERGSRRARPLIKVNCAAIPRELFESEFFGHAKGAFTGAHSDRIGRFELANGGTLFLDEMGELPIELQGKLLRVLEEGQFERVGDARPRSVDVRIISATNRDLSKEMDEARFRRDLYYRLNVFPICLPPLRNRREDIAVLAEHILAQVGKKLKRPNLHLTPANFEQLQRYDWPGNVREMQNLIERAVIVTVPGQSLLLEIPNGHQAANKSWCPPIVDILSEATRIERDRLNILAALERAEWKISGKGGAAELLGTNPTTLRSRIRAFGIKLERIASCPQ